jgi:hypothetical protein
MMAGSPWPTPKGLSVGALKALAPDRVDDYQLGRSLYPQLPGCAVDCSYIMHSLTDCLALVLGGFSTCSVCFWDLPTEARILCLDSL